MVEFRMPITPEALCEEVESHIDTGHCDGMAIQVAIRRAMEALREESERRFHDERIAGQWVEKEYADTLEGACRELEEDNRRLRAALDVATTWLDESGYIGVRDRVLRAAAQGTP